MARRRRRRKPVALCEYYTRAGKGTYEGKEYAYLACKACSFTIGFSDNASAHMLNKRCFNSYYIVGDFKHARDSHIKQYCKKDFVECRHYIHANQA